VRRPRSVPPNPVTGARQVEPGGERAAWADVSAALRLRLDRRPDLASIIELRLAPPEDQQVAEILRQEVADAAAAAALSGDPYHHCQPMQHELPEGEIVLGRADGTEAAVYLSRLGLTTGLLATGRPGSGKTNFLSWVVLQLIRLGIP